MMLNSQLKKRLFNRKRRGKLDFIVIEAQKGRNNSIRSLLKKTF